MLTKSFQLALFSFYRQFKLGSTLEAGGDTRSLCDFDKLSPFFLLLLRYETLLVLWEGAFQVGSILLLFLVQIFPYSLFFFSFNSLQDVIYDCSSYSVITFFTQPRFGVFAYKLSLYVIIQGIWLTISPIIYFGGVCFDSSFYLFYFVGFQASKFKFFIPSLQSFYNSFLSSQNLKLVKYYPLYILQSLRKCQAPQISSQYLISYLSEPRLIYAVLSQISPIIYRQPSVTRQSSQNLSSRLLMIQLILALYQTILFLNFYWVYDMCESTLIIYYFLQWKAFKASSLAVSNYKMPSLGIYLLLICSFLCMGRHSWQSGRVHFSSYFTRYSSRRNG